jgi:sterol desaturase/sphingolipid hydroxylase (fatty acid hydroxylase superfamily)
MEHFNDPLPWFIPVFLLVICIESYISYKENRELYDVKDSAASIGTGIIYTIINSGMKLIAFQAFSYLHQFALIDFKITQWYAWILLFFADDFTFYWYHRLNHQVRLLWSSHINHHSSVQYNFSVALRKSWADSLYKFIFWLWLPLLGFPPLMVLLMMSISFIYQFWIHTQIIGKLGFLELFMNTPSHHRVHHASNIRYLDRNHGGVLIIWDKLFGTFEEEKESPVFGITSNINSYNLLTISTHAFVDLWKDVKRSPDFKTKFKYIYMPPGWTHDGQSKTSEQLKKEMGI